MSLEHPHKMIAVTGVFETPRGIAAHQRLLRGFGSYGISTDLHTVGWDSGTVTEKVSALSDKVEHELSENESVSLLGLSAGGALSLAVLLEHPELAGVVTVSAIINTLGQFPYSTQEEIVRSKPLFGETIMWLGQHQSAMTPEMRERVMTLRVRSGDRMVDPLSAQLVGARNVEIPYDAEGHGEGIFKIMRSQKKEIALFVKGKRGI